MWRNWMAAVAMVSIAVMATTALAQGYSADKPVGATAQNLPSYLSQAGLEERLGNLLPMDAPFTDEAGNTRALRNWFDGRPVAMALVYYRCIMLCPQVLYGMAIGLRQTTLTAGKDYDVVIVSIDPMDKPADAANEKAKFLDEAGFTKPSQVAAVHFLTGAEPSIQTVAAATGFHYVRVPGPDGKMDQFAHSSVIMFVTPDGKMSKYLSGIDYPARDLRLALLEASQRKISNPVDLLILYCCNYNPASGRYTVAIERILGLAAMATLVIVAGMIFLLTRKPKGVVTPDM